MKKTEIKLSDRRAPQSSTQAAVMELLRKQGPLQQWQIDAALGRNCHSSVKSLVKQNYVEQYLDDDRDPNPMRKYQRTQVTYFAFLREFDKPIIKGVSETSLKWAAKVLRAAGWTVIEPSAVRSRT